MSWIGVASRGGKEGRQPVPEIALLGVGGLNPHNDPRFGFVEEGRLVRHARKSYGYEDEILMAVWLGLEPEEALEDAGQVLRRNARRTMHNQRRIRQRPLQLLRCGDDFVLYFVHP